MSKNRDNLPCSVAYVTLRNGSHAYRATATVAYKPRKKVQGQGPSAAVALSRLIAALERQGYEFLARKIETAVQTNLNFDVSSLVEKAQRPKLKPLSFYVERNLRDAEATGSRNKETAVRYRGLFNNHVATHPISDTPLNEVNTSELEDFFAFLSAKTDDNGKRLLGPSPLRSIHGILSQTFETAIASGLIDKSPLATIQRAKKPRKGQGPSFADTPNSPYVLADIMRRLPYETFLRQFPLFLGLRTSERLGLRHCSFEPDNPGEFAFVLQEQTTALRVTHQLSREKDRSLLPLKTDGSYRSIPVPLSLFPHLDALYLRRAAIEVSLLENRAKKDKKAAATIERILSFTPDTETSIGLYETPLFSADTFLFTSRTGTVFRQQKCNELWREALTDNGFNGHIREHDFRHVFASFLSTLNFPEVTIAGLTGHSIDGSRVLAATYTHDTQSLRSEALAFIAALYARPAEQPETELPETLQAYAETHPLYSLWRLPRVWDNPENDDPYTREEFWEGTDGQLRRAAMNLWLPTPLRPNKVTGFEESPMTPEMNAVAALDMDTFFTVHKSGIKASQNQL